MCDERGQPKRVKTEQPHELGFLNLGAKVTESLYWGCITYGHPACPLPPPPGAAGSGGLPSRKTAGKAAAADPPSIAEIVQQWINTNPAYSTAPLTTESPPLSEADRVDLVQRFVAAIPKKMRETNLAPELATAAHDSFMLRLGRKYGDDPAFPVPSCCNGQACSSLKIKRAFGTPLERYYTPSEHARLQQRPADVEKFGGGPCLVCIRHDVETLVRCSVGRAADPQAAFGQPYAVLLRVFNTMDVPGGYHRDVFSSSPVETPEVSPLPLVASRTADLTWQYRDGAWFVDQTPFIWNPGHDF